MRKYSFLDKVQLKLIYLSAKKLGLAYIGGHFVKTNCLDKTISMIDLGANRGVFYESIGKLYSIKGFCVEANRQLYEGLSDNPDFKKYHGAVCDFDGETRFSISQNDEASSINKTIASAWNVSEQVTVPAFKLLTLMKQSDIYDEVDILKVDIEGSEIAVFESLSDQELSYFRQITVEFHEFLDDDLRQATYRALSRFSSIGFKIIVTSTEKFSEVLLLRNDIKFSFFEWCWYFVHQLVRHKF